MRSVFLIIIASFTFLSCKQSLDDPFYKVMNQNFLKFTDTAVYRYGKFLPAPNEEQIFSASDTQKFFVLLDTVMRESKAFASALQRSLTEKQSDFKQLIDDNQLSGLVNINTEKITNTGRYKLIPSSFVEKIDKSYAGQIVIHKPYIKGDKAIVFFSIHSSPKAGLTKAFFLKKVNSEWNIVEDVEIQRS